MSCQDLQPKHEAVPDDAACAAGSESKRVDVYWLLAMVSVLMFLLCFFLAKNEPGEGGDVPVH
jgi:hypothetical protein